jgi:hypothetical protein
MAPRQASGRQPRPPTRERSEKVGSMARGEALCQAPPAAPHGGAFPSSTLIPQAGTGPEPRGRHAVWQRIRPARKKLVAARCAAHISTAHVCLRVGSHEARHGQERLAKATAVARPTRPSRNHKEPREHQLRRPVEGKAEHVHRRYQEIGERTVVVRHGSAKALVDVWEPTRQEYARRPRAGHRRTAMQVQDAIGTVWQSRLSLERANQEPDQGEYE